MVIILLGEFKMITAQKSNLADWILYRFFRRSLRNHFFTIRCRGIENLRNLDPDSPTLAFSNHTNWWDGLLVYYITRLAPHKSFFVMMDERQLSKNRFLRKLGAFSVDLTNPLHAAAAIRYAVNLLQTNNSLVWIFPQGELVAPHLPVKVKQGTNYLASKAPHAQMLTVAFRFQFFKEDRPEVWMEILPHFHAKDSSDERIEDSCNEALRRLDLAIANKDLTGFERILEPKLTINKKWEWVQLAVKGKLKEFNPEN